MEIIITHPTVDEYYGRLVAMAKKYHCESWIEIRIDDMTREERFEYSFIVSAVGDQLRPREFAGIFQTPSHVSRNYEAVTEPGLSLGSVALAGVKIEKRPAVCGAY